MQELKDTRQKLLALPRGSSSTTNPLTLLNTPVPVIKPAQLTKVIIESIIGFVDCNTWNWMLMQDLLFRCNNGQNKLSKQ